MDKTDKDLIEHWLSIQSKEAQRNLKIKSNTDFSLPFVLHIDKNTPKEFMPQTASSEENYTTSRVTCGFSLVDCIYGYARAEHDFLDIGTVPEGDIDPNAEHFKGGYDINRLDFEHLVVPSEKLVPDAKRTNEVWLVSYSEKTVKYKPKTVGKLFFNRLVYEGERKGQRLVYSIGSGYIHHTNKEGIAWDENTILAPGYFRFDLDGVQALRDYKPKMDIRKCVPCSQAEYESAKKPTAATLSADQPYRPKHLLW